MWPPMLGGLCRLEKLKRLIVGGLRRILIADVAIRVLSGRRALFVTWVSGRTSERPTPTSSDIPSFTPF